MTEKVDIVMHKIDLMLQQLDLIKKKIENQQLLLEQREIIIDIILEMNQLLNNFKNMTIYEIYELSDIFFRKSLLHLQNNNINNHQVQQICEITIDTISKLNCEEGVSYINNQLIYFRKVLISI